MSIDIIGLNGVIQELDKSLSIDKIKGNMMKACALVERSAKENAPKDTGELRRSITSTLEGGAGEITGVVFTPLEYAPYVEFGTGIFAEKGGRRDVPWSYQDDKGEWHSTSGMKPHPFMRPALDDNRERILSILKEGIGDG